MIEKSVSKAFVLSAIIEGVSLSFKKVILKQQKEMNRLKILLMNGRKRKVRVTFFSTHQILVLPLNSDFEKDFWNTSKSIFIILNIYLFSSDLSDTAVGCSLPGKSNTNSQLDLLYQINLIMCCRLNSKFYQYEEMCYVIYPYSFSAWCLLKGHIYLNKPEVDSLTYVSPLSDFSNEPLQNIE